MNKVLIKIAGLINLITAFVHLIIGQMDLVVPLDNSNLQVQQKAEWVSVWHMVTILLFFTSFLILKAGFGRIDESHLKPLKTIGLFYILVGVPFMVSSIFYSVFAPQWILLLPIGVLLLFGLYKLELK